MTAFEQTKTTHMSPNTITAFFDDRTEADHAVERLVEAGIPRHGITTIAGGSDGSATDTTEHDKGFWGMLSGFFMADDDRHTYAEGLRRGGYLVTVSDIPAGMHDTALDILDDEGSIDIDERSQMWESEGWSRDTTDSSMSATSLTGAALGMPATSDDTARSASGTTVTVNADGEEVIPVVQEELRIGKRDVNNGRVKVRSYISENTVSENVSLRAENVEITRRAVDRPVTDFENAFVDRMIEADEHREEAVVSKEARVVEEIALRKTAQQREETVSDTVRKTEVEIEDDRGSLHRDGLHDDKLRD